MKHRNSLIYFVTSNHKKFASLQKLLQPLGVDLRQLDYDFDEGRGLDIQTIAKSKLSQAKKAFPNKRLIVDDRGFFILALKGFPGPFVKLLLDSFSYPGIIKLMQGELIVGLYFLLRLAILTARKIIYSWRTKRALLSMNRAATICTAGRNCYIFMGIRDFPAAVWQN